MQLSGDNAQTIRITIPKVITPTIYRAVTRSIMRGKLLLYCVDSHASPPFKINQCRYWYLVRITKFVTQIPGILLNTRSMRGIGESYLEYSRFKELFVPGVKVCIL